MKKMSIWQSPQGAIACASLRATCELNRKTGNLKQTTLEGRSQLFRQVQFPGDWIDLGWGNIYPLLTWVCKKPGRALQMPVPELLAGPILKTLGGGTNLCTSSCGLAILERSVIARDLNLLVCTMESFPPRDRLKGRGRASHRGTQDRA